MKIFLFHGKPLHANRKFAHEKANQPTFFRDIDIMITLLSFALRLFSHLFGGGDGDTHLAGTSLSQVILTTLKGNSLTTIGNVFYTIGDDFSRIFLFLFIWFQCRDHE